MEGNLLRKESEFYKLNEQLELKAQKLMEEVEYVMKNPDIGLPKTASESTVPKSRVVKGGTLFGDDDLLKCEPCTVFKGRMTKRCSRTADNTNQHEKQCSKSTDIPTVTTTKDTAAIIAKLDGLPDAAKGVGPEAALHILKVKRQLLEQELETVELEMKNKTEMWKKSRQRFDQLEEDHEKWNHQAQNLDQLYQKQQDRLQRINKHLLKTDAQNNSMLKEVESLRKELKRTCQSGASNKAKMNRCLDENGKLKSALCKLETEETELRELDRKEKETSMAKINVLERRKTDLLRGVSTQLELLGNLRSQIVHMDVLHDIDVVEERLSTF